MPLVSPVIKTRLPVNLAMVPPALLRVDLERPQNETIIGYAPAPPTSKTLPPNGKRLAELGVSDEQIYLDHGLTGTTRAWPGSDQALAAVRPGDTLVVPKLDRLARSVPKTRAVATPSPNTGSSFARRAGLRSGRPDGQDVLTILATFAEFEVDLRGCAPAKVWPWPGRRALRGKQPKLSPKQQVEFRRMHTTGPATIRSPTSPSCSPSAGHGLQHPATGPELGQDLMLPATLPLGSASGVQGLLVGTG
ncbi:hypothetical protein E1161_22815 [Saccharopolyspora aridisoli]|uniref:Resolvase/invertase-type recombinase catalytic domain-containing protein n=1 Tax=Saccharopolyspora aridisoli TaxID=2530385 RepID=A0A4V2Y6M8_9PSEU|nr:recombinase family protein [Saccharopolyspora aridisoli]TDC88895.1 hypothetical protein E1161_22815 [Saccharopolyspora aridisoli]